MTEQTIATIVIAGIATIPPTAAAFFAYLASRKNASDIKDLKVTVDGRLTQLLEVTRSEQHAIGREAGVSEERGRDAVKQTAAAVSSLATETASNVASIATDMSDIKRVVLAPNGKKDA